MPDLPTIGGGPSETGSNAAASGGVVLTANASTNTKATTWTEIIAATDYTANWLLITLGKTSTNSSYLVDIGVGASTAEVALIDNLYTHCPNANSVPTRTFLFPLRVPAGTRLSGRCQSASSAATVQVAITAISSGIAAPPGLSRVETIGANTADSNGVSIDCGATPNTDVVGELTASSGFPYRWMCLAVGNPTDITWLGAQDFLADVTIGAGGSELPVISDLLIAGSSVDDRPTPGAVCFPCSIGAGSRVAVRVRDSGTTAGDRVLDWVGYGVG
jgi:hypothetical protein